MIHQLSELDEPEKFQRGSQEVQESPLETDFEGLDRRRFFKYLAALVGVGFISFFFRKNGWAGSSYETVDQEVHKGRLYACRVCPNLKRIQDPSTVRINDVCALAGTNVEQMTWIASERCPARDPDNLSLSRWKEPFVS